MMDARIILAGQQPDMVNILARSNEAAQQRVGFDRQNALARMYQEQGPGIAAGDQGALNALARFDPQAALGVQEARQGMQATQQGMDILSREEQRQVQEAAASMTAAQRAAEAQKIEDGVKMGLAARSPQEWDAMMQQVAPELVGQFGQREGLANRFMSIADIMKRQDAQAAGPEFRPATPEEAARYGATGGQIGTDGRFYPINPPSGMSIENGPDGLRITQGPGAGAGAKPLTEGQSKDNVFATRAEGALRAFEPVADAMTSLSDRAANMDPTGVVRSAVQSDQFQVAQQSGNEFLQAILRKDTGAAITKPEQDLYGQTYIPQPGDNTAVLAAKRDARARAVEALKAGMSIEQITMTERALVQAAARAAAPQASGPVVVDGFQIEAVE
jgi:hypothetical protein